jgi:WD40 repeat protein/tetratricopeptide (TPR) repeat protein
LSAWDVRTGERLADVQLHRALDTYRLATARDGRPLLLLFRAPENQPPRAEMLDVCARTDLSALPELATVDLSLQPSPGTLMSVSPNCEVRWWDTRGQLLRGPWRPRKVQHSPCLTADGSMLVALSDDQRVRWYDLASGLPCRASISLPPTPWHSALSVSPDGTALLVHDSRRAHTQLWHLAEPLLSTRTDVPALLPRPARFLSRLTFHSAAFSPDGTRALVGAHHWEQRGTVEDRYGRLMDVESSRPIGLPLRGATSGTQSGGKHAFSPDGKMVASCTVAEDLDLYARVWNAFTGEPLGPPLRYPKYIHALEFSPDSRTLAVGTVGPIVLWDLATSTGKLLRQVGPVASLRFTPDGRYLAGGTRVGWQNSEAGTQLWDVKTGKPVAPLVKMADVPRGMAFLPDGRTLLAIDPPHIGVARWDAPTGRPVGKAVKVDLPIHIHATVLRPDGAQFATGTSSGRVQMWDIRTGQLVGRTLEHGSTVHRLTYSRDGKLLAAGCMDGTLRLWDVVTSAPIGPPLPQAAMVIGVAFDPAGRALTTTVDGMTRAYAIPAPVPEDGDLLEVWLKATTGVRGEREDVVPLEVEEWRRQRELLRKRWPAGERAPGPPEGWAVWHDLRAREAAQAGQEQLELLHLGHWIDEAPNNWLAHARRAAVHSAAGRLREAGEDYARAAACGGGADLLAWGRHRSVICNRLGQHETEKWYLDRLLAVRPHEWRLSADRAEAHGKLGRADERSADLWRAVKHGADQELVLRFADEQVKQQKWREALELCERAARQRPRLAPSLRLALLARKLGDNDKYRSVCAASVKMAGARPGPELANYVGWSCALGPGGLDDYAPLVAWLESALAKLPPGEKAGRHAYTNTLGAVLYRAGRHKEAVRRLNDSVRLRDGKGTFADWAFLALAQHRLGNEAEAKNCLAKVRRHEPNKANVWSALEADLLRAEVESALAK